MPKSKKENTFLTIVKNIMSAPQGESEITFPDDFTAHSAKVFARLKQPCFIFASDKKIIYANPSFLEVAGLKNTPAELEDVFSKKDLKPFISKATPVLNFEDNATLNTTITCGDKTFAATADICFLSKAGSVSYGAVTLREVSDSAYNLKNVELDILKSRNYLQILFSALPMALYVRDRKGNVVMSNAAAQEILGTLQNSENLKAFDSISLKKDLEQDSQAFDCGCLVENQTLVFTDVSGTQRSAHIIKAPVKDESGNINTVLTLFEDITARKQQEEDILRDRNLLQSILDYAPMAIYTRGSGGGLTFWNKRTMDIFEDNEETVAAKGAHQNQTQEEAEGYQNREEEIIKEGKVVVYEQEPYVTREGNNIMLRLVKVPIPASGNNPPCVLTIAQDITERYIQEQETFKTQNIIQTIFNNAPIAIYARDEKGELLFRNRKTLDVHGCKENEEFLQESAEQKEFYKKREQAIIKSGKTLDLPEEEYIGPDGKKRILHAVKVPVFDSDGKPLMVITIGEDVTLTREKEKEVLRSKNFLQEVIDNLPVALYAKKYTGEYILWNKKSEDLFGKKAEEVIGKTHHNEEINPEQEEFIRMQEQKVFDVRSEVDIPQELISTQKDGIKIMHTVKTPLFYEDGTPNCLLGVSEDITVKTKMERQVYEAKTKYSLLVENSREGILIIEQGKVSFANKTLLAALGYKEGELDGKGFAELAAQENQALASEFYDKAFAGTAARDFAVIKLNNKNKDEVVEFEVSAAVSKYLGKKILIMFLRNITKEHRIEDAVKTKDDKFRQAFENAKTPFALLQNNGYVYDMNRAARDLFGFTKEDKAFYSSVYIKPGLPLEARKAMENLDSSLFEAKIDFDKLKQSLQNIVKSGTLDLSVSMTPVNERQLSNGRVVADYLMELTQKINEEDVSSQSAGMNGDDVLAYQDAVILCNRQGLALKCNVQAEKLFNLSFNKIQGRLLTMFFSQNDTIAIEADINELYSQGGIKSRSYTLKTDGGTLPVEASAVLAKNNNFLISFRNNVARQQLIDTLRERSQYMQALYTVIDTPVLECEVKDGEFLKFDQVNVPACAVTGYSRQELLSRSLADFLIGRNKKEEKKVKTYLAAKIEQLKRDRVIYFEANLQVKAKNILAFVRLSYFDVLGKQKALITLRDSTKERVLASELEYKAKELEGIKDALPGLYLKVDKRGYIQEYKTTDMSYNIAVFPTDFVNKNPYEILSKETADSLLESLKQALSSDMPVHTSFSMQYGSEHRFYEASISRIKGEDNAIVLVKAVDRRKGLANKIHQLYTFSSNKEASFVENMNDVLEFGKQAFGADVGIICHFSGEQGKKMLINYATRNEHNIAKGMEAPVDECFARVREGELYSCTNTDSLECKDCLHLQKGISSIISAPLYLDGEVEGAISFLTVGVNRMMVTEEDRNFMGFIGGLMGLALELRQSKKAVDNTLATLRKLLSSLDVPACITDKNFAIKNANGFMLSMLGLQQPEDAEGKNLFMAYALDALKAEGDFRSAQRTSKGGAFDFVFDFVLADGHTLNLLWHAVEIKDGKGQLRGYLMVSENFKDLSSVRAGLSISRSHI